MHQQPSPGAAEYAAALADAMSALQRALYELPDLLLEDPRRHADQLVRMRRAVTDLWLDVVDSSAPSGGGR